MTEPVSPDKPGEQQACAVPLDEQCEATLRHYEEVTLGREWNNQVPQAIRAWYAAKSASSAERLTEPVAWVAKTPRGEVLHMSKIDGWHVDEVMRAEVSAPNAEKRMLFTDAGAAELDAVEARSSTRRNLPPDAGAFDGNADGLCALLEENKRLKALAERQMNDAESARLELAEFKASASSASEPIFDADLLEKILDRRYSAEWIGNVVRARVIAAERKANP